MSVKKMCLIFVGIFAFFSIGGIVMALIAGHPIDMEKQMAENFYYSAIGFAVYHIFTRNKQIREDKAKKEAEESAAASGEDHSDDAGDWKDDDIISLDDSSVIDGDDDHDDDEDREKDDA